jgi:hypothetical protein
MSGSDSGSGFDSWEDIPMDPTPPSAAAAVDSEPEWDSDDFVPPPVGNVSATPAPIAPPAPVATPAPVVTAEPVEPAAPVDAELEFDRSLFGSLAISAPVTPATITKDVRGGGRNRKHKSNYTGSGVQGADWLYQPCKDFVEKQPIYKFQTPSQKSKFFKAFFSVCKFDDVVSMIDTEGEGRWINTEAQIALLWADFIRTRGSAKGSVLRY